MRLAISYLSTGIVFLALDTVWLTLMASRLYRPKLDGLMADQLNLPPAILFYLLYIAGIVVFAVQPGLASGRLTTALALGAFLGLVAYGTYDLTNHATLRDWPVLITIADLIWGTVLTGVSATLGMVLTRAFMGTGAS